MPQSEPLVPGSGGSSPLTEWRRPVALGLSVGHPSGSIGSIGPFVELPDGRRGFVSTSFVLAPRGSKLGDRIHQPGPSHVEVLTATTRVATLVRAASPVVGERSSVAAALAEWLPGAEPAAHVLPDWSAERGRVVQSVLDPSEIQIGDDVAFVGCGSTYSTGRIAEIEVMDVNVQNYAFDHVIVVRAESAMFSQPGDGGALVYRRSDCRAIGLLFARTEKREGRRESLVLPLAPALDALGVCLVA